MVDELPVEVQQTRVQMVAALAMKGTSVLEMSKQLRMTRYAVNKIMLTEEFKELLKTTADEAVLKAKALLRSRAESLAPEVWETIVRLVRSDKGKDAAEGLKAYFRLIGLDKMEENEGASSITINLPGQKQETVIELPKEKDDASD